MATRMNLSIPQEDEPLMRAFTAQCKYDGMHRSAVIIELIKTHGNCGSMTMWQEAVADAAKDEPLPEFLR